MPDPVLEVTDLHKRYGAVVALDGVSLAVEGGEVFGLIGPNGAGKTTLLSVAAGLLRADEGTVRLFRKPFTRDSREWRHLVGMGTQDLSIYPDLTARENLRFFGKLYGLGGKKLNARVDEVLAAVALLDRADDRVGTFSGGMKRRLNLAAAIVHGPKLLFLDEPTAGVDPQSRNHIFEQVKALNAAGLTVIYTSHYMEEVQTLCDRIAILDGGTIRASGTLPSLLKYLDATIRVTVANAPADFAERLKAIPGVKSLRPTPPPPLPEGRGEESSPSPLAGEGSERTGAPPVSERVRGETGTSDDAPPSPGSLAKPSEPPSPARGEGQEQNSPSLRGGGRGVGSSFDLVVEEIGPVLARVATACAQAGADLLAATTSEPTLERVFLHLTGRALRD